MCQACYHCQNSFTMSWTKNPEWKIWKRQLFSQKHHEKNLVCISICFLIQLRPNSVVVPMSILAKTISVSVDRMVDKTWQNSFLWSFCFVFWSFQLYNESKLFACWWSFAFLMGLCRYSLISSKPTNQDRHLLALDAFKQFYRKQTFMPQSANRISYF